MIARHQAKLFTGTSQKTLNIAIMPLLIAYISLVLLWSTTPLAVKWSGVGVGFLFGATGRMVIGLCCVTLILLVTRQPLVWHRQAFLTYIAIFIQLFVSMILVNWAAQFVPSGWISVVFGLVPLLTALIAAVCLGERSLSWSKIFAYLLAIAGLALMFGSAMQVGKTAVLAISGLSLAAALQAASAVWVKHLNAQLPALVQVGGGLLLAVPAYLASWWLLDGQWPAHISLLTAGSIIYLGGLATTLGFGLYYFILKHLPTSRVALISLMSPVLALLLGNVLNHEPLTLKVILGMILILFGLMIHAVAERKQSRRISHQLNPNFD